MTWNYRVIKRTDKFGDDYYQIFETYYDKGDKIPHTWSSNPMGASGETLDELRKDLEDMMEAVYKPVLIEIGDKLTEED